MSIESYEYNGFKYIKDYFDNSNAKVSVLHQKGKPEYLFKYYSFSKYNIDALVNGYFYASHPIELNDNLDSSALLFYTNKSIEFDRFEKFFLNFGFEDKEEIKRMYNEDNTDSNRFRHYIYIIWSLMTNAIGIISTSGKEHNPLMWPHYTQEKGFQLKIKTDRLEESINNKIGNGEYLGLIPINYCSKISPIDISNFRNYYVPLYYAVNIKSIQWKYEDEWRFIVSKHNMGVPFSKQGINFLKDNIAEKSNRYVYYDKSLVEGITLGSNFFNNLDFELEWIDEKQFTVSPRSPNNGNYENQIKFLEYIIKNLKDRVFYSGVKYELDNENNLYLIRTKERIEIEEMGSSKYIIKRTGLVIKFFNIK